MQLKLVTIFKIFIYPRALNRFTENQKQKPETSAVLLRTKVKPETSVSFLSQSKIKDNEIQLKTP